MAAGFIPTKAALDQRLASVVVAGESWLEDVQRLKTWLDGQSEQDLVTLGYSSGDVAELKSAATDLDNLRKVGYGQSTQAVANNFFFWAWKLRKFL
jgi:hypothetical protein